MVTMEKHRVLEHFATRDRDKGNRKDSEVPG